MKRPEFHPERNTDSFKEELVRFLKRGDVFIEFEKVDGTIRQMTCTLKEGVIPKVELTEAKTHTSNPARLVVFDTEKTGWRTVKFDKICSYKVLPV